MLFNKYTIYNALVFAQRGNCEHVERSFEYTYSTYLTVGSNRIHLTRPTDVSANVVVPESQTPPSTHSICYFGSGT